MKKTEDVFNSWNKQKKNIEFNGKIKKVKYGEIWLAKIGINIGSEISKDGDFLRPVLIIANHMGGDLVSIIPITSKYNKNYEKFLFEIINYSEYGLKNKSYFSLNNFRTISIKRLEFKINGYFRKKQKFKLISKKFIKNILMKKICKLLE